MFPPLQESAFCLLILWFAQGLHGPRPFTLTVMVSTNFYEPFSLFNKLSVVWQFLELMYPQPGQVQRFKTMLTKKFHECCSSAWRPLYILDPEIMQMHLWICPALSSHNKPLKPNITFLRQHSDSVIMPFLSHIWNFYVCCSRKF